MLRINLDNRSLLDLYVLHGEDAVQQYFDSLKEETINQIKMLKKSGKYQEYEVNLHQELLDKVQNEG